jgi:tetratricopeptide (TPR) repeat protein
MKKILFAALLLLSLTVCLTSPAWAGGSDDVKAGRAAFDERNYDKAIRLFTKAIEIEPKAAFAYINRGYAWEKKGNYDKGIADLTKAIEINPMFADAYFNRAYAWYGKGDSDKAIADLTKAIEINPKHAIAYSNRGNVWEKKRNYDKAVVDYTRAIEIDPKFSVAYNNLAWLMATCPDGRFRDGKRAVELAEKAVALGDAGSILDTLAAAYAEAGRFQEAIKTQERVITKCKKAGETKDLPEYEEQLSSYKAGKPWREK